MADQLYLPQVDYTSRDYASLRDDLIALIPNFAPNWTSRDTSDFGIVLIELFSYIGDVLNYNIDRAANESFINTSTQRDTVLNIAKLLNYTPNDVSPATGTVTLSNYGTADVTLYGANGSSTSPNTFTSGAATSANTASGIVFTLDNDITLPGTNTTTPSTASATVTQGQMVYNETVAVSDGTANQDYTLNNTGVISSVNLQVSVGAVTYSKVSYVIDYGPTDTVYSVYTDGDGVTHLKFGDGVSGTIPPNGSTITATYRYSSNTGVEGNIGAKALTNSNVPNVTITNDTAFAGGSNPETTDSIRVNTPLSLRALSRPVSLKDYASLAVQVSGVSKAIAISTTYTAVTLFIAASGGATTTSAFKSKVSDYFAGKTPPGTTLTVKDFAPVYPYIKVTVDVLPQYNAAATAAAVSKALYTLLAFDNVNFNDLLPRGDLYAAIQAVPGVNYVTINDMEKFYTIYSGTATASGTSSAVVSTSATTTGTSAANSTTISSVSTSGVIVGMFVSGAGVGTNAAVVSVGTGSLTVSATNAAQIATGAVLTFSTPTIAVVSDNTGIWASSKIYSVNGNTTATAVGTVVGTVNPTLTYAISGASAASTINVGSTYGIVASAGVSGTGIAAGATVSTVTNYTTSATTTASSAAGSTTITCPGANILPGMTATGSNVGTNAVVVSTAAGSVTVSATSAGIIATGTSITFTGLTATLSAPNTAPVSGAGTFTNTKTNAVLQLGTAQSFSNGDVIVVESSGTTVADLAFNLNEVPVLEQNYIKVITTGGTA